MASENKRIIGLDVMKAIAIIMVVTLHLSFWNGDFMAVPMIKTYLQYCFRLIAEGVPVFLFVNGYLLFSRPSLSLKKHYRHAAGLLVILISWAVILTVVGNALSLSPERLTPAMILRYVFNTQVGARYTGVLWFIQSLLSVYLVFPLMKAVYDREELLFGILFGIAAFFTIGMHSIELIRDLLGVYTDVSVMNDAVGFLYRFSPLGNAYYIYYFLLGGMAFRYRAVILQKKKQLAAAAAVSWAAACAIGIFLSHGTGMVYNRAFNYGSVFMTVIVLGLFSILYGVSPDYRPVRLMAFIGQRTMSIYLIHFVFVFIMDRLYPGGTGSLVKLLFLVLAVAGSICIGEIIKRIPVLRSLITG